MKKILISLFVILFGIQYGYSAIVLDTKIATTAVAATSTLDVLYTTTGTFRILYVTTARSTAESAYTGVTYAGVSMIQQGTGMTDTAHGVVNQLWALENPASGSNKISITRSANGSIAYGAISFSDTAGAMVIDNNNATGLPVTTVTSYTATTTANLTNCWSVLSMSNSGGGGTLTGGTNTSVGSQPEGLAFNHAFMYSTAGTASAGLLSLITTVAVARTMVGQMGDFCPSGAVSASVPSTLGFFKKFRIR